MCVPANDGNDGVAGNSAQIFLSAQEAAELLRISPVTLSRWRIEGRGPEYRKFGRRVRYGRTDLITWADAQRRRSTSAPAFSKPAIKVPS
jgi:excisionase family DNA binding protein